MLFCTVSLFLTHLILTTWERQERMDCPVKRAHSSQAGEKPLQQMPGKSTAEAPTGPRLLSDVLAVPSSDCPVSHPSPTPFSARSLHGCGKSRMCKRNLKIEIPTETSPKALHLHGSCSFSRDMCMAVAFFHRSVSCNRGQKGQGTTKVASASWWHRYSSPPGNCPAPAKPGG